MEKMTKRIMLLVIVCGVLGGVVLWHSINSVPPEQEKRDVEQSILTGEPSSSTPYVYKGDFAFDSNLSNILNGWRTEREILSLTTFSPLACKDKEKASISVARAFGIQSSNVMEKDPYTVTVEDNDKWVEITGITIVYATNYPAKPTPPEKFISDEESVNVSWVFINSSIPKIWQNAYPHIGIKLHAVDADKRSDGAVTEYTAKVISFELIYDDYPISPRITVRVNATGTVIWLSTSCDFAISKYGWINAKSPSEIVDYLRNTGVGISKQPQNVKEARITDVEMYYVLSTKLPSPDATHPPLLVPLYVLKITIRYNDGTCEIVDQNIRVELA